MAAPVITTVSSPVQVGRQFVVTGTNFGRVSAVALENTTTHEIEADGARRVEASRHRVGPAGALEKSAREGASIG